MIKESFNWKKITMKCPKCQKRNMCGCIRLYDGNMPGMGALVIGGNRYYINKSGEQAKHNNEIKIQDEILFRFQWKLSGVVTHFGESIRTGSYSTYFCKNNEWYKYENSELSCLKVAKLENSDDYSFITRNCCLFVYRFAGHFGDSNES